VNHSNRHPEPESDQQEKDEYNLSFIGIDSATGDYVDWPRIELNIGDRIELEILNGSDAHPPALRRPHGGDATAYSKKDYIRSMAKKYGWEIIEPESES